VKKILGLTLAKTTNQNKEEYTMDLIKKIWAIEDEVANRDYKCDLCQNVIRPGHNYYVLENENFVHASCQEKLTAEKFTKPVDYTKMTMNELVTIWLELTGKKIKAFSSLKVGAKRVAEMAEKKGANDMIFCPATQAKIPMGGCETRQADKKFKCTKECGRFVPKAGTKGEKAPKTPRTDSKLAKTAACFAEKDSWTIDELIARSGFDKPNLMCMMSIFQNPKRMKEGRMILTDYDKKTSTYTLRKEAE
jgi:hypothetical protein